MGLNVVSFFLQNFQIFFVKGIDNNPIGVYNIIIERNKENEKMKRDMIKLETMENEVVTITWDEETGIFEASNGDEIEFETKNEEEAYEFLNTFPSEQIIEFC